MINKISDIWKSVLSDKPKAWHQLVIKFTPLLFSVTRRYGLTQVQSEDIAQQTWMDLYKSRHSIRDSNKLPGWLIKVTSRKTLHLIKKIKKDQTNNIDFYFLTEVPLPDEEFLIIEQHERLKLAMEQLDQRCQAVLTAIFNASSEKTYRDIAQDLNMPLNSLGPTRIRCLKKLKIIFENLED